MSEHAASEAVTEIAKLLKISYIKDEGTEFLEMMGVKISKLPDDGNDEVS